MQFEIQIYYIKMTQLKVLYEDKFITINEVGIIIRKYYFPLATSKTILFSEMQAISIENA